MQALIHGLGRHYYSLPINYRKNELEQKVCWNTFLAMLHICTCARTYACTHIRTRTHTQMLLNLHKKTWMKGLQLTDFKEHSASNEKTVKVWCGCGCGCSVLWNNSLVCICLQDMLELASAYNKVPSVLPLVPFQFTLFCGCRLWMKRVR